MHDLFVQVIGGTTLVGEDEFIILEETQILWTREGRGSKLVGRHVWPFRFTLPKQVQVKRCGTGKHNLPPTFAENGRTVYIDYRLLVDVKRGDFLRLDKTLATTFGYEIDSVSEPLSELRQLAYTEEIPLFGPGEDPYGWKVFPALTVKGTLSGKAVEVEITLAISNPVCPTYPTTYAIGYPIPLRISLTSKDTQALEELAKPTGVGLELVRSMASGIDAFDDNSFEKADDHFFDSAGFAFWWSTPQADPDPNQAAPNTKELRGELDVPRKIKPTFLFPRCSVRYTLELLPLSAPGWVNKSDTQNPLLSERVTIVSRQAPGMNVRFGVPLIPTNTFKQQILVGIRDYLIVSPATGD
ncbi:hypothetical protein EST38_g9530 [Candolleomyces aberdarensis]|uniref:Arrestin-like N-terminal domain-containing protein n=1 Tax=Candolleomyces aberdarensis TaxID=2316362 RepID=A0A4V1Q2U7_9AGAR|nr:hypothetical protein EST38_g9530 [Candolleomyces aberdarensis]